jgi:DNA-binding LacI/PurR family transcriptional regulator
MMLGGTASSSKGSPTATRRARSTAAVKLTLEDIGREAGVSAATVSRVINGAGYVSAHVRERVMQVVERRNFLPNANARSLATGQSNTIGLIISDITNPFFPELVKGIETAAFKHGYEIVLANTNYDPRRMSGYVKRFIDRGVAGVALMTSEFDPNLVEQLAQHEVSVIFLDSGRRGPHVSHVAVDYATGIDEAVTHLIHLGHERIAYVGGPPRLRSLRRRLLSFHRSIRRQLGRDPLGIFEGDLRVEGGRRAAEALLASAGAYTAVVAANDLMAVGVMQACRLAGLRIPDDISVVGFDDIALATIVDPPLTTVALPRQTLGEKAVEALVASINHPRREGLQIPISTSLVIRQSTAAARGRQRFLKRG